MNINEEKRNQWQALKGMGFKAHWEYFWDYYKIHVIVAVLAIVFVVTLVKDIRSNKPYALNAIFINSNSMSAADDIATGFAEARGINTEEELVYIDPAVALTSTGLTQNDIAQVEKIYAMIAAKELDVCVTAPDIFRSYSENEMFLDLREAMSDEEIAKYGDRIMYVDNAEVQRLQEERQNHLDAGETDVTSDTPSEKVINTDPSGMADPMPIGVVLTGSTLLNDGGYFPGETPIAGIVISSEHEDNAAAFIEYLLK